MYYIVIKVAKGCRLNSVLKRLSSIEWSTEDQANKLASFVKQLYPEYKVSVMKITEFV